MAFRLLLVALLCLAAAPATALADDELIVSRPGGLTAAERARRRRDARAESAAPGRRRRHAPAATDAAACGRCAPIRTSPGRSRTDACSAAQEPFAIQLWGLDRIGAAQAWPARARRRPHGRRGRQRRRPRPSRPRRAGSSPGYDYVGKDSTPGDESGHGTHVTGTIVAAENGVGVEGVAPDAQAMPLRVLDGDGGGYTADIATAFALRRRARHPRRQRLAERRIVDRRAHRDPRPSRTPCSSSPRATRASTSTRDPRTLLARRAQRALRRRHGRRRSAVAAVPTGADSASTSSPPDPTSCRPGPAGRYMARVGHVDGRRLHAPAWPRSWRSRAARLERRADQGRAAGRRRSAARPRGPRRDRRPAQRGADARPRRQRPRLRPPPRSRRPRPAAPAAAAAAARVSRLRLRGKPVLCRRPGCRRRARLVVRRHRAHARHRAARAPPLRQGGSCRWRRTGTRRRAVRPGTQAYTVGAKLLGMRLAPGTWRVRVAGTRRTPRGAASASGRAEDGAEAGNSTAWPHRWTRSP